MEIIDRKGRLLGKVNIIDLIIIALILVIIPSFFCIYKRLSRSPGQHKYIRIEALVFTLPEIIELIKEGDKFYNNQGVLKGTLVKIIKEGEPYYQKFLEAKTGLPSEFTKCLVVEFDLRCIKNPKDGAWYYSEQPLLCSGNETYTFNTDKYRIPFFVIKIKNEVQNNSKYEK